MISDGGDEPTKGRMVFASGTSTLRDPHEALEDLIGQLRTQVEGPFFDFAMLFLSLHHGPLAAYLSQSLRTALAPRVLIGCTGEGIIGRDREIEKGPAMTLIAGRLPGVDIKAFALRPAELDATLGDAGMFLQAIGAPHKPKLFLVLGDPYTAPMDGLLSLFNVFYADVPVVGGMASGPQGQNMLLLNDQMLTGGAIGIALAGALEADVIVSQGCRPIGHDLTVTRVRENIILELDSQPPLRQIEQLVARLSDQDRDLLQHGLYVGRAIEPEGDVLGRGDFLIRGLMGVDEQSGAIAIGDMVEEGETIRFHLRDAVTAKEDLELMLTPQMFFGPPSGGLLFSCNGRGTQLYGHPDGDISTIQHFLNGTHLAGFFCAGEIGPIGGKSFLHGHTASLVLFRTAQEGAET